MLGLWPISEGIATLDEIDPSSKRVLASSGILVLVSTNKLPLVMDDKVVFDSMEWLDKRTAASMAVFTLMSDSCPKSGSHVILYRSGSPSGSYAPFPPVPLTRSRLMYLNSSGLSRRNHSL